MKKFTTVLTVLTLIVGLSLAGFGFDTDNIVIGTDVQLLATSPFRVYLGYAGVNSPWLFTIAKDDLRAWTGTYSFGAFYEWYFTPNVNIRAGADVGLITSASAPTELGTTIVSAGPVFQMFPWLGVGLQMGYQLGTGTGSGSFTPKLLFELYPFNFGTKTATKI